MHSGAGSLLSSLDSEREAFRLVRAGRDGGGAPGGFPLGARVMTSNGSGPYIIRSGVHGSRQVGVPVSGDGEPMSLRIDTLRSLDGSSPAPYEDTTEAGLQGMMAGLMGILKDAMARPVGSRVRLCALKDASRNGLFGEVMSEPDGETRQVVRLEGSGQLLRVRSINTTLNVEGELPSEIDPEATLGSPTQCSACGAQRSLAELSVCVRCRMVRYCGVECQRSAWKAHKPECTRHSLEAGIAAGQTPRTAAIQRLIETGVFDAPQHRSSSR